MIQNGQEVATTDESTEIGRYRGESWDALKASAHEAEGSEQVKADLLKGWPFIAVYGTIRRGDYIHVGGCGKNHPYMYLTTVIGDDSEIARAIRRGRIAEENAGDFVPGEVIGFVEAGTGLYRQVLAYLESQDYIQFPEGPSDGAFGESRFDSLPESWGFLKGDLKFGPDGEPVWDANFRLYFPRGLRISEYENEFTKQGKTRYAG